MNIALTFVYTWLFNRTKAACFLLSWRTHPLTHSIQANSFSPRCARCQ